MAKLFFKNIIIVVISVIVLNNTSLYAGKPHKIAFQGEAQGTSYHIIYIENDTLLTHEEIDSVFKAFDISVSIFNPFSIISRMNKNDTSVRADAVFEQIFNTSMQVSERTKGAFDITVGQLVNAWGFGFMQKERITREIIDSLRQFTGYKKIKLENGLLVKDSEGIMIDFNAIAQGWIVDIFYDILKSKGINNFLVEVGGEVRVNGKKEKKKKWQVAIENPTEQQNDPVSIGIIISLQNMAIATSGSYRKFYEENGIRYSHTLNPYTGYPAKHNLLSVSVVAEKCAIADAYATAFMVMGYEKSVEFLDDNPDLGLDAYFICVNADNTHSVYMTSGFQKYMQ